MKLFLLIIIIAMPVCTLASPQDNINTLSIISSEQNDSLTQANGNHVSGMVADKNDLLTINSEDSSTDSDSKNKLITMPINNPETSHPQNQQYSLFADFIDDISTNQALVISLIHRREKIINLQVKYTRKLLEQHRVNKFCLKGYQAKLLGSQLDKLSNRAQDLLAANTLYTQIIECLSSENPIEILGSSIFLILDSYKLFIAKRIYFIEDLEFITKLDSNLIPPFVNYHYFVDPPTLVDYYLTPLSKQNSYMQNFCQEITINFLHQDLTYYIITIILPQCFKNMDINKFFNNKFINKLHSFFATADINPILQQILDEVITNVLLSKNIPEIAWILEPFWQTKAPGNSFYNFLYNGCVIKKNSRKKKQKKLNRALAAAQQKIMPWRQPMCKHKESFILRIGITNFFDTNSEYFIFTNTLKENFNHYCKMLLIMQELLHRQDDICDTSEPDSLCLTIAAIHEIDIHSDEKFCYGYDYVYKDFNYHQPQKHPSVIQHDNDNLQQYIARYLRQNLQNKLFKLLRTQINAFKWDTFCKIFNNFPDTTIHCDSAGSSKYKFQYRLAKNKTQYLGVMHRPHPGTTFYKNNFCYAQKIFLNLFQCNRFTMANFEELELTITTNYLMHYTSSCVFLPTTDRDSG